MVSWKDAMLRARLWIMNAKDFAKRKAKEHPPGYSNEWWEGYVRGATDAIKLIEESGKLKEEGR